MKIGNFSKEVKIIIKQPPNIKDFKLFKHYNYHEYIEEKDHFELIKNEEQIKDEKFKV